MFLINTLYLLDIFVFELKCSLICDKPLFAKFLKKSFIIIVYIDSYRNSIHMLLFIVFHKVS